MKTLIAALVALILAADAVAQTTRAGEIEQQQAGKAKELGAEGPSEAEQIVRRVLMSPLLNGGDGAYPWFGSVYGGTGFAAGGGYLRRLSRGASLNAVAAMSINASKLVEARFTAPELWHGSLRIDMLGRWIDANELTFYGFGPGSSSEDDADYDFQPAEARIDAVVKPHRVARLGAGYSRVGIRSNWDLPNDADDEIIVRPDAPGIGTSLDYNVVRGIAAIDWRTSPGYSTRGGYYGVTLERHHATGGLPYSFTSTEVEAVQLVPLVREQFVFALRGLATFTNADDNHAVPVMLAPFLGSGSTLRGFSNRRFTDRNRALLSGEYRWRPSRYLDMALFLDAGQVAANRRDLRVSEFETSYGIGARFHGPNFNALRIELARGREGMRLIVGGSQAF